MICSLSVVTSELVELRMWSGWISDFFRLKRWKMFEWLPFKWWFVSLYYRASNLCLNQHFLLIDGHPGEGGEPMTRINAKTKLIRKLKSSFNDLRSLNFFSWKTVNFSHPNVRLRNRLTNDLIIHRKTINNFHFPIQNLLNTSDWFNFPFRKKIKQRKKKKEPESSLLLLHLMKIQSHLDKITKYGKYENRIIHSYKQNNTKLSSDQ